MPAQRLLWAFLVATSLAAAIDAAAIDIETQRRLVTVEPESPTNRPSTALLRQLLCQMDSATVAALKQTIGRFPGGATFSDEKVERTKSARVRLMDGSGRVTALDAPTRFLAFSTPYLKGDVRLFINTPGDAILHLEGVRGPLFESADRARRFLASIHTPTPLQLTPLDARVLTYAFSTTEAAADDGLMLSRVQPRTDGGISRADRVVAIDLRRNTLDAMLVGNPGSTCEIDYVSDEFCRYFERLGEASQRDFASAKGPDMGGGDHRSTMSLPEATDCRISAATSPLFNCSWRNRPPDVIEREFNVLSRAIQACFPTAEAEESDGSANSARYVDLHIPQGMTGGPSRVSVDLEPQRIVLTVQRVR